MEFPSNSEILDIGRKRGSQPSISYFDSSWIEGHSTTKTWQNHNIPFFCSREALEDSIYDKDSSSPRPLFLLISRWQNTSITGWLWATRTLRNPKYATKAARDRIVLTLVQLIFAICSWSNATRLSVEDGTGSRKRNKSIGWIKKNLSLPLLVKVSLRHRNHLRRHRHHQQHRQRRRHHFKESPSQNTAD